MLDFLRARTGKLLVTAHRGAKGYAPENTMPAFQKALELGADVIEFDVQRSKDGQCFVMHDELLDRTTNGSGLAWNYSWAELSQLDAGVKFDLQNAEMRLHQPTLDAPSEFPPLPLPDEQFAGTRLPRLEEVLEWAKAVKMPVAIEIKTPFPAIYGTDFYPGLVEQVLELIARYGDENMSELHSFDHRACLRAKQLNPRILTQISFSGAILIDQLSPLRLAQADGMSVGSLWANPDYINLLHENGYFVFAWGPGESPYREEAELAKLVGWGVDFVSGGYPDILRQVVSKYLDNKML